MTDAPKWSPQQDAALRAVREWLKSLQWDEDYARALSDQSQQVFRLFGYAGTGKTTLAQQLAEDAAEDTGMSVTFAAFTGKATLVLRSKGCSPACTLHSLLYIPETDEEGRLTGFRRREWDESGDSARGSVELPDLIVVDEASMIDQELGADLAALRRPILALGDPAQLPPVRGEPFFAPESPDIALTEIHRQAADNPIIRMSIDIREGRSLQRGSWGESRVMSRSVGALDDFTRVDQVLCGRNRTRHSLNANIRGRLGFVGDVPCAEEKLVCLKNDRKMGLLNGQLWTTDKVQYPLARVRRNTDQARVPKELPQGVTMRLRSADDAARTVDAWTLPQFFTGDEEDLPWQDRRWSDEFTYGYALTVHKSQGSQWPSVTVVDESSAFRENARKHLYTAVTRAAEKVTVLL